MRQELLGIGGETPPVALGALIIELRQEAISGVGIQTQPCYRSSVSHKEPLVMVDRVNNLADAGRIRICSFTESLNCSVQQVVRFSIYQEAIPTNSDKKHREQARHRAFKFDDL
jgi:hypothetical protein